MSGRNQTAPATITNGGATGSAARSRLGYLARPAGSLAMLAIAGLLSGVSPQAEAAEPGGPEADHVFAACTFANAAALDAILTIDDPVGGEELAGALEASYILIYVRANPNDGQELAGESPSFTGPVLCINEDTETIDQTTETTGIPNTTNHGTATSVDILDTEEAFHLRYLLNFPSGPGDPPGDVEKRVCHTVAGNTDCFFIQAGGE